MGRFDILTQLDNKPAQQEAVKVVMAPVLPIIAPDDQFAGKPAKKQTGKEASQQGDLPANVQTSKGVSQQRGLPANQQTSKILKKFSSYLTDDSLKRLKRIAFETDRKDYEVLQEAVDLYLQRNK